MERYTEASTPAGLEPLSWLERTDAEQAADFWHLEPEYYAGLTECTRCGAKPDEPCWDLRRKVKPQRAVDYHRDGRTRSET
jgi:hypothetical protein